MSRDYEITVKETTETTYRVMGVKSGYEAAGKVTVFRLTNDVELDVREMESVVVKTDLGKPRLVESNVDGQMTIDDIK